MKTILPSVEELAEALSLKRIEIEALLDEAHAAGASIAEKNAAISEDSVKLITVIENIDALVHTCRQFLYYHGEELATEVSKELAYATGNNYPHHAFIPYPNPVGVASPVPIHNPPLPPARFPADGSFRTHDQTIPVVMGGMMSPQKRSTAALKPTGIYCQRCGHPPGDDWLDDGETCPQCKLVQ